MLALAVVFSVLAVKSVLQYYALRGEVAALTAELEELESVKSQLLLLNDIADFSVDGIVIPEIRIIPEITDHIIIV